jgi:heat shock protein HslJ
MKRVRRRTAGIIVATLATAVMAPASMAPATAAGASSAPSLEALKNASYQGFAVRKGKITLANGLWEGMPFVEGGAARPRVSLVRSFRLAGDLDNDGREEAVVLLAEDPGGSGSFVYLAIAAGEGGKVRNLATTLLGDRVQVRDARIVDRRVVVDLVRAGPDDALCCPGELATRVFRLAAGRLREETAATPPSRLTLDAVGGVEWVLRFWDRDEAVSAEPEVTLSFQDGRFAGRAGCNRYFSSATPGGPGEVTIGPVGATQMACPAPAMETERRFLDLLGAVKKYGFLAGQLQLTCEKDGARHAMLFDRRPLPARPGAAPPR